MAAAADQGLFYGKLGRNRLKKCNTGRGGGGGHVMLTVFQLEIDVSSLQKKC